MSDVQQALDITFAQIRNDPNFAALSYDEQQSARAQIAAGILGKDPKFQALSSNDKGSAIQTIVSAQRPVFSNKQVGATFSDTMQKAEDGTISEGEAFTLSMGNGLISNGIAPTMLGRAGAALAGTINETVDSLLGTNTPSAYDWNNLMDGWTGKDGDKLLSYVNTQMQRHKQNNAANAARTGNTLGSILGFVGDIAVFHSTWSRIAAAPVKAGGLAIAKRLPTRTGTWLGKVALPSVVSASSSGAFGVFREQFLAMVNGEDERRQNSIQKVAKTFGSWAALDFALNITLGTIAPHIAGAWRRSFGKAKRIKIDGKRYSPEDINDLTNQVVKGTAPEELMQQMNPTTRRYILGRADLQKVADRLDDSIRLRPYDDLVFEANSAGMTVYRDPSDGLFYIYHPRPEAKRGIAIDISQADDIISAKRTVSAGLRRRAAELSGDAQKEFIAQHKSMLQYDVTNDILNGSFDPTKVKGYITPGEEDVIKQSLKGRSKDFVSPINRPYVGRNEAEVMGKAFGDRGYVKTIKAQLPDEVLSRIRKGGGPFETGMPVTITPGEQGDELFVMIRNPAKQEAVVKATANAQSAISQGAPESVETLRNMYLMESGFDGIIMNDGSVQMFYPDKLKLVATKFDPYTGKIGDITVPKDAEQAVLETISQSYKGIVGPKAFSESKTLISDVASSFKGKLNKDDVQKFSRMILSQHGIDPSKVTVRLSKYADKVDDAGEIMAEAHMAGGRVIIDVPRSITTPKAQKKFIKELFDEEFRNVIDTMGDASNAKQLVYPRLTKRTSAMYRPPYASLKANEAWLRSSVEDIAKGSFNKTAKGYMVKLPGKTPIEASTIEEITDRVIMETMDPAYLRFDMARRGYKLTVSGNNITVRGKGLDKPITGTSINEVADKLNYRPSKISNRFAPRVTAINDESVDVAFDNGVAIGSRKDIKKLLSKFEDMDHMARLKQIKAYDSGEVYLTQAGSYEVHMPEYGIIEKFKDAKSAHAFLRSKWKDFDEIKRIAERKGLQVWHEGAVTKLSDGTNTYAVKTKDEMFDVLKEYPDSTGGRSILPDVDPDTLNAIDKVLYDYNTAAIPMQDGPPIRVLTSLDDAKSPLKPMGASGELRALIDNMDHWAEVTLKKMGADDILRRYRNVENAYRLTKNEVNKAERALKAIFTDDNGKILPLDRRKAVFYHAGAQTADEQLHAIEMYGKLSENEQRVAANLRRLLGEEKGGVVTGLAGTFGITPDKFVSNYMPRIMDWASKNKNALASMTSAEELVEAAMKSHYGSSVARKLKAFFKNMRTSEVLTFEAVDDPIKALQHYFRVGFRQKYMGRAWEELYDGLVKAEVGPGVIARFDRYRETLMGMNTVDGMKHARRIGEALGKKLGIKNGEKMMEMYFSMNYFANMGYRPWLAVRNTFQVYTTLAPRMGNSWVDDAIGRVAKYTDENYRYLEEIGVIPNQPPIVNTVLDADSFFGKVVHKSLGMFKSSDEYTRAVAYETAVGRFNFALNKWKKGGIKDLNGFLKEAGVTKMDDDTIREVSRLVQDGGDDALNAARARFGTQLSEETMFGYRASQSPMAFTGSFWGKIFGQYGTYSAGYRANIARGALSNGNVADKVAFAARFVANHVALYEAFNALGIDARNFIPGSPALFGGGPQFEVAVALAEAMSPTYKGKQARAQLTRKFSPIRYSKSKGWSLNYPEMLPGSIQLRYAKKSLDYLDQGDYWKAFLAATTTPVVDTSQ